MSDLISRQAAIDAVMRNACNTQRIYEAIKGLPSEQPETHDKRTETHARDLIARRAAIDALNKLDVSDGVGISSVACDLQEEAIRSIENLPSAQPERKRGKWIYGEDNPGTGRDGWFCSECEHFEMWDYSADMKSAELNLPNFCPNCGADMREDEQE